MKLNYLLVGIILILVSFSLTTSMIIPANENGLNNGKAPEHSQVITQTEEGNWDLERVDFIHYAKPIGSSNTATQICYKLIGVKWTNLPVNYVINPTNSQGLSESFITSTLSASAETWDSATSKELFNNNYSVNYSAKYGVQNYNNVIEFGQYSDNNVIAVTSVWYTRVGKKIVEFDQLYNTNFNWGDATINQSKMDLQNIAVHELGHAVGLADIYSSSCSGVTMYGYSSEGETQKRTLENPDITGLRKMYGV